MDGLSVANTHLLKQVQQLRAELDSAQIAIKECTAELIKSEDRFTFAMQATSAGLWDWDLQTDEVYYSSLWKSMLGYNDDELDNNLKVWASIIHPDEKAFVLQKFKKYISGKINSFTIEMRMCHKEGHYLFVTALIEKIICKETQQATRLFGIYVDVSRRKRSELFDQRKNKILKMIAQGVAATKVYDEIALLYEERYPGLRCSMLELQGRILLHGGAPSLPDEYCQMVHGLKNGPNVASCGTSTYTGERVLVENIETDPKWDKYKHIAMPYGMRCCWSEPIKNSSGSVLGAFGMYYDYPGLPNQQQSDDLTSAAMLSSIVMERDHNQKRIQYLAFTDELTDLSSRAKLHLTLEDLIIKSSPFCLLYVDLDNFKDVNDSLGHDIGDLYLQEIAKRLISISPETDSIARIGGDEFCIIIKERADSFKTSHIAQQCLNIISKPTLLGGRKFMQTCSIGVAQYPDDGDKLQSILKAADTALYEAKERGKNYCYFYNRSLTQRAEYRFQMEQYLKEAITQNKLSLLYQPVVDIASGQIEGVEALSRWYHPELGQVSPTDFIVIAERIGMLNLLTENVLKTACEQATKWRKLGLPEIRVAINISPDHFLDRDFVPFIKRVIDETGIIAKNLKLEVTENVVQTQKKNIITFKRLKELGVLLAIDDFGTGYSSFASLKHLNVDFLKIDKYFIDDMLTDKKTQILITSMVEMGHNLGYKIIAEGVEYVEQLDFLKKIGCENVQGNLYSKPVDATKISELLKCNF